MVVGEFTTETELVVIGSGPGGCAAALRAAELGLQTTLVDDRARAGGTWLHEGCMLAKALVSVGEAVRAAADAAAIGVRFGAPAIDLAGVRAAMRDVAADIAGTLEEALRRAGIARVQGSARFESSRQLTVAGDAGTVRLRFKRAILATGSRERGLDDVPPGAARIGCTASALALEDLPGALLVVGGNAAGLEIAAAYAALGSRVTVACADAHLVPLADHDLVAPLEARLARELASLRPQTAVREMAEHGDGVDVVLAGPGDAPPRRERFDRVILATGRRANLDGLDLERTRADRSAEGFVRVDEHLRTADPRLFAIGDVVGPPMLAPKAEHQGRVAAEVAAGWGSHFDVRAAPMVLFTTPQLAWCGLTEREAAATGQVVGVERTAPARGATTGIAVDDAGFTKLVFDPDTGLVLGMGIVGPHAAERIAQGALAIEMGAVVADLASIVYPHPTFSESVVRAARQADRARPADA